ncbi:helix-turn-helix domain-containing protein [Brevundimonas diminuta]|uniref:helix-turn-helix domain-containing protein n=1 Tax=Brevundimonas diminuta TaxID=293 RepID=UPI003D9A0FFE
MRKAAEITQVELAERLGKPQSFVSKVERGERRLDVIEFCQVSEALGCDPATLLKEFLNTDRDRSNKCDV